MIQLSEAVATAALGGVVLLVAMWAGWYSVGAASRGPGWALNHLHKAVPIIGWAMLPLLAMALLTRPLWAGLGAFYVLAMVWWLMGSQRRSLALVEREIGFEVIDPAARQRTIRRVRNAAAVGGLILAGLGVLDLAIRGWPGVFALGLGLVLGAASWLIGRSL